MANPPFNVDKVKAESASAAGRLPFGLPGVNAKTKEIGNANYLWISYFYAYLNEHGRAGFVMASSATDSANKDRDIREKLVRTGDVDVMVSVGNNFFYTLSLPCSLWFFDRNKHADIRDKVLFIDARNYYTVVDRTLNEWTEWQLRNMQAIVHLYRGEKEKYLALMNDYDEAIAEAVAALEEKGQPFSELIDRDTQGHFWGTMGWIANAGQDYTKMREAIEGQISQTKACMKSAEDYIEKRKVKAMRLAGEEFCNDLNNIIEKRKVKAMRLAGEEFCNDLNSIITIIDEREWLVSKFGTDGTYQDILGLCKIATIQEIEEKNYSLTPGAYVGVAEQEDDGVDFHERMNEIHAELAQLNSEANTLMAEIQKAWEELK